MKNVADVIICAVVLFNELVMRIKKINLLYEYDYDDVDIILVPESIANNICDIVQEFQYWLSVPINKARFTEIGENGSPYLNVDTEEFLWWQNCVKIYNEPKAGIVSQHGPWQKRISYSGFLNLIGN